MHDDRVVAKRLLAGDEETFQQVFDQFFPRLYRYALARVGGDREEARDVAQQTFCRAFESLDSYRGEASLYGWMCQICRNSLIDLSRKRGRSPQQFMLARSDDALAAMAEAIRAPEGDEPEQQAMRVGLLQLIQATLDCLPPHYGDVLEWKYLEGESVKEIAKRLNVRPKAAESVLTRARQAFREAIVTISESADLLPDYVSRLEQR